MNSRDTEVATCIMLVTLCGWPSFIYLVVSSHRKTLW